MNLRLALAILSMLTPLAVFGGDDAQPGKGIVRKIKGAAQYDSGDGQWKPLTKDTRIVDGATIKTGTNAMVDISLGINGTVLRVAPETTVKFEKMDFRGSGENAVIRTLLALEEGRILGSAILIGHESRYEIKTPTGVSGLRGEESAYDINSTKDSDGKYETIYICLKGTVVGADTHWVHNSFVLEPGQGTSGLETKPAKAFHLPPITLPKPSAW